jgi:hypothetical protein
VTGQEGHKIPYKLTSGSQLVTGIEDVLLNPSVSLGIQELRDRNGKVLRENVNSITRIHGQVLSLTSNRTKTLHFLTDSLHSGQLNGQCGVLWTKRIQELMEGVLIHNRLMVNGYEEVSQHTFLGSCQMES